ncbi:MAG: sporulation protein YqfD [Lachnospiraceae bacterium]|nr:sporulation protein YqfD [Lachnospiraceae bacterium]
MKGKFLSWIRGNVRILVTGGFCERFLNLCAYHQINLWDLQPCENGYEASLSLAGFWKLKPLVRKCRIRVRVLQKAGLPFFFYRYRKRKPLFLAMGFSVFLLFFLSLFIWDIKIDGNLSVTDEKILDYLKEEGIQQGIWKTAVDYKLLAADLRQFFPELTWVSVKLQGTRLLISLKENEDPETEIQEENGPCDLVSTVDGTVTKIITRAGTPQVTVGAQVKKGDLLVSGCIELINDSGEVYDRQYVAADADIYVRTSRNYQDRILLQQPEKVYTGKKRSRFLLKFGSFHLGLPFFGKPYLQYDCVSENRQFRLMENFYLPIFFSSITLREYQIVEKTWTPEQAEALAKDNLNHFLEKIQEKGVQIFQNNVKIETADSVCTARGTLIFVEKTGKRAAIDSTEIQKEGISSE